MVWLQLILAAGAVASTASSCGSGSGGPKVSNLVSFGDSYTDEGRLSAYFANNGSAPPPGTSTSGSNFTASGGYAWGHFASQQLGAKYYDYAGKESLIAQNGVLIFCVRCIMTVLVCCKSSQASLLCGSMTQQEVLRWESITPAVSNLYIRKPRVCGCSC